MKVHHLNCGTMRPLGTGTLVCHVLLVESAGGLVLVDSGFGSLDCHSPARFGRIRRRFFRPAFDPGETALGQIEKLGYRRSDVRHIIVTHFDADHIGGIADFPDAQIHVTASEALGAMRSRAFGDRIRFRSAQWAHGPKIVEHDVDGEAWRGFATARELTEIAPGFVLVPLPGHTRGHACVAVDAGHRWVLHAGDAFYQHGTLDDAPRVPVLTAFEKVVAFDRGMVGENHARLVELYRRGESDLLIVCSHDPTLYERARSTASV
ncbi:MBL fold metallo-hydrolase [Mycolicibacterium pyrenivorans]|uniref:MBL fold metallo-hydrolase n=1 Tax=Mycolicibacterium pyrenivorans TaxID=187102 RepID=UPI0021F2C489|nr:MBL fold metallo-hydrolase [Mycolicibacterium pyrenivorans]MCV7150653.1 MBL fold metallo-hydrolase [Mycolicibacterium pyrenivorans]